MDERRYLHSDDPDVRRWSAVVYSIASGSAALAWAGWGGLSAVGDGRILDAAWLIALAAVVWFVVAGIGLRIVTGLTRRRSFSDQPLEPR